MRVETASPIPLRCRCGRMRGVADRASGQTGVRIVCYCGDCQAFARFVEQPGVTDAAGGTDIFQMAPARVHITEGLDALACVRLSEKGLFRWYAGCCRTPVGNMVGPRVPFIGVIHSFMDHGADGRSRDERLGKPIGYVQTQSAVGPLPPEARTAGQLAVLTRCVTAVFGWWLRGLGTPTPFFDAQTKAPRMQPRVLTPAERAALRA